MLKLDNAQVAQVDLERKNDELQLSNKDLKHQLEKWQNLGNNDEAALEELREERALLDGQVTEYERLTKHAEKKEKETSRIFAKEQKRIASLILEREELQVRFHSSKALCMSLT